MQIIEAQTKLASTDFDLGTFMNTVVEHMQLLTPATGAVVELIEGDDMVYKAASGSVGPYVGIRLKREGSLSGLCVSDREIKISVDTAKDSRVDAAACLKVAAASMICAPLSKKGAVVGVLKVVSNRANAFSETDVHTLRLMAGLVGSALAQQLEAERRRELEEELALAPQNDALTELPNRALFLDRLEQAILRANRGQIVFALLHIDIDSFKTVNNTHGNQVGDALLSAFAKKLRSKFKSSDTLARWGGDKFMLLAEKLRSKSDAELLAKRIVEASETEFDLGTTRLRITSSIGVAVADRYPVIADELLRTAENTLAEVKKAGRNGFRISYMSAQ